MANEIESGYGLVYLNQIVKPENTSGKTRREIERMSESMSDAGFNITLPIVCLTDEEEKYQLLTGLPVYEAALNSSLDQIWVLLLAFKSNLAEKFLSEVEFQKQMNERLFFSEDWEEFRKFMNDENSSLTSLNGIGSKYAQLIQEFRPYDSRESIQKFLGARRSSNWLKSYKSWKSYQDKTQRLN